MKIVAAGRCSYKTFIINKDFRIFSMVNTVKTFKSLYDKLVHFRIHMLAFYVIGLDEWGFKVKTKIKLRNATVYYRLLNIFNHNIKINFHRNLPL
jgi:hypothetical protein